MNESDKLAAAEAQLDVVSAALTRAQQRETMLVTSLRAVVEDIALIKWNLLASIKMKVALGVRMMDAAAALDGVSQRLQALKPPSSMTKK